MRIEEEALPHGFHHHAEAAHGDGESQFIGSYVWPHRRIEQTEEAPVTLAGVFHNRHRNNCAATRTELGNDGIIGICIVESPAAKPRKHVGRGIEQDALESVECLCLELAHATARLDTIYGIHVILELNGVLFFDIAIIYLV